MASQMPDMKSQISDMRTRISDTQDTQIPKVQIIR